MSSNNERAARLVWANDRDTNIWLHRRLIFRADVFAWNAPDWYKRWLPPMKIWRSAATFYMKSPCCQDDAAASTISCVARRHSYLDASHHEGLEDSFEIYLRNSQPLRCMKLGPKTENWLVRYPLVVRYGIHLEMKCWAPAMDQRRLMNRYRFGLAFPAWLKLYAGR